MRAMRRLPFVIALAWLGLSTARADDKYRPAPAAIREVLRAPASPTIRISPDGRHALFARPQLYPSIAELAAPMLRVAGVRITPANNGLHSWPHYQGGL